MYNDTVMSFEELLIKDKTFTIHHQNIWSLTIKMHKAVNIYEEEVKQIFCKKQLQLQSVF